MTFSTRWIAGYLHGFAGGTLAPVGESLLVDDPEDPGLPSRTLAPRGYAGALGPSPLTWKKPVAMSRERANPPVATRR